MRITQQEGATGSGRTFWLPLTEMFDIANSLPNT
jgi:hypothetical protein